MQKIKAMVLATSIIMSGNLYAETRIELQETTVQGASELPKVLYILPWQKTDMDTKPVKLNTMVDEVMAPVDRDILRRQVQFYEQNKLGQ